MLGGRSAERSRPEPGGGDDGAGGGVRKGGPGGSGKNKRGPGARAGRRDYSHLPRFKVVWDFEGGGYCCPECGEPFTLLGDHITELLDWVVIVRVAAHCRRRYRRLSGARGPAAARRPRPPKEIGEGLVSDSFTPVVLSVRVAACTCVNSLVPGVGPPGA